MGLTPRNRKKIKIRKIYGNILRIFVGIMSFKDGLGLIIESEEIYKTLKSIFEMNWLMLKK